MRLSPLLCILVGFVKQVYFAEVQNVTIGYLTVDKPVKFLRDRQGRIISGAISYAIELINKDDKLLKDYQLNLVWDDTQGSTLIGTRRLTEQWRDGAVAFIGFEVGCAVEASVAASWNLPLISYKCADTEVSDKVRYPTFARTFPPATQVTKSIISVLLKFNWKKFTLIVGSSHKQQTIAERLLELTSNHNISLNARMDYTEPHIPLTMGNQFPGIVQRTYITTRVYVLLGSVNAMIDLMTNLYDRGLLDTGEYVVIYVDHKTFDHKNPLKYYRRSLDRPDELRIIEASRSLFIIASSPPSNPNYTDFQLTVDKYNQIPPFGFPNPFRTLKKITVYAAYLYDAMMLYARAANEVVSAGGDIKNGSAIINKMRSREYKSIMGVLSHIDKNGDAEGNYTLLARIPYKTTLANYSMQPVGYFQLDKGHHALRFFDGVNIEWVNGKPPIDEPACGYLGERCIPPKQYTLQIVGAVLGGLTLIGIIVIFSYYRKRRYEQEIRGLLWKIPIDQIRWRNQKNSVSNGRRDSHASKYSLNSTQSFDSRMSFTQIYTKTTTYKGQIVAMKVYEKKNLDISRKMQKEMKLMRDYHHNNVNTFIGACIAPPNFIILTEYCAKGSLQDILENEDFKLDDMFIASLVKDIIQGMIYIHGSELNYHGNLKSSNCVVNSRFTLQVADFGLLDVRAGTYRMEDEHAYYRNLFWKAPEHLRNMNERGSQKGDVFSFGIIVHEIIGRCGPYGYCNMEPKAIIENVRDKSRVEPFRPDTKNLKCEQYVVDVMKSCWEEDPDTRPDFRMIFKDLSPMRKGMKRNIFDNMMAMMESYQCHLKELVDARTDQLVDEKRKTEVLLHRMLPSPIAEQLKRGRAVEPESFNSVTIYFSDICGFTVLSAESTPMQVVDMLNSLYTCFDTIAKNYDAYKVETIGDAYMVVSGVPIRNGDNHAGEIASMSLELLRAIKVFRIPHRPDDTLHLRIGIHSGPCVAGVVGSTMPRYTLFGDTVNTASRMESNGEALKIHCSKECKSLLDKLGGYTLTERGYVNMKGKGELFTYWLVDEDEAVRHERLRRCSEVFKYNSPWARESRRVYMRHGDTSHMLDEIDNDTSFNSNFVDNCEDFQPQSKPPPAPPLMELLRESSAENNSLRSNSPRQFSSSLEQNDSPRLLRNDSIRGLQCLNYRSPAPVKGRFFPNGILSDDKRFMNMKCTGSGTDLVESTALIADGDDSENEVVGTRHSSLGSRQPFKMNATDSLQIKKLFVPTVSTTNNNGTLPDSMPLEERCCNTEPIV